MGVLADADRQAQAGRRQRPPGQRHRAQRVVGAVAGRGGRAMAGEVGHRASRPGPTARHGSPASAATRGRGAGRRPLTGPTSARNASMWRHRRVGVLDVDVVPGAGHHLVAGAEPGHAARRAPRRSSSRHVSSWSPVSTSTGHRTWRISASSMATLNSLGMPTPNIGSAFHTQPPSTSRAPWRARCSAHSAGQPRVVAARGTRPSPRPSPRPAVREQGAVGAVERLPDGVGDLVGRHQGGARRAEPVDVHDPADQLRERAATPVA